MASLRAAGYTTVMIRTLPLYADTASLLSEDEGTHVLHRRLEHVDRVQLALVGRPSILDEVDTLGVVPRTTTTGKLTSLAPMILRISTSSSTSSRDGSFSSSRSKRHSVVNRTIAPFV